MLTKRDRPRQHLVEPGYGLLSYMYRSALVLFILLIFLWKKE